MRRSVLLSTTRLDLLKRAQQAQAERFASLDAYTKNGVSSNFDQFMENKRMEERFENFDQRVEHAFQRSWAMHETEIWNAHKRKVRNGVLASGLTPQVMTEIASKLEDRKSWLRDVWAQVDADYRSGDDTRVEAAVKEIEQAHSKEGNAYMEWAYQTKYDMRFMGPKEREDMESKLKAANFPDLSDEEIDRYMNRRTGMNEMEEAVIEKFGLAGRRHWDVLQQAKDDEYREKIDMAVSIYEALKTKEDEAEEVAIRRGEKSLESRKERSNLRLKKALEREEERQRLFDLDSAVEAKQKADAFIKRKKYLKTMMDMRTAGADTANVLSEFRRSSLADLNARNNLQMQNERSVIMEKKKRLFDTMRRMQQNANERAAIASMAPEGRDIAEKYSTSSLNNLATGVSDIERAADMNTKHLDSNSLWKMVHDNTYKTPSLVIHQARIDAHKTYSAAYSKFRHKNLRNIRKMEWSQGHSGFESRFMHAYCREQKFMNWGIKSPRHKLNDDPNTSLGVSRSGVHAIDPKTGKVDLSKSHKHDRGIKFTGKRFTPRFESDLGPSFDEFTE